MASIEIDGVNGVIKSTVSDADLTIKGNDGGSEISALTFDMSDAGTATFNHDIKLGTDQIAKFGDAANLQIYANNINSFITESGGSGNLKIQGQTIRLEKTTEEIMLRAVNDAQVELYYDNVIKVLTSSTGINLPVDGDSIKFGANSEVVLTHVHDSGLKITHDGGGDPDLILANTASASDGNQLGSVFFNGQNSNGDEHTYAFMLAQARDVTDGEEDGQLVFYGNKGGSDKQFITYGANANGASPTHEVCINEGSEDIDFRVESDNNANALFVNGANGNIGLGTSSESTTYELTVHDPSNAQSYVQFTHSTSGVSADDGYVVGLSGVNALIINYEAGAQIFYTNQIERMRLSSGGVLSIGTTGTTINSSNFGVVLGNDDLIQVARNAGASSPVLDVYGNAGQFRVMGDGDIENTNNRHSIISDERIKTNITDANSQWDDIKAIEIKNFERKDDVAKYGAGKTVQIGVIAQQAESISPGLVRERDPTEVEINMSSEFGTLYTADDSETKDGNDAVLYVAEDHDVVIGAAKVGDIKTEATHSKKVGDIKEIKDQVKSFSSSILYMKAIKALQEAMAKIETLETKVKALEDA